ncbi:acetyl-CoA acetyltransferase [soil metagenome]
MADRNTSLDPRTPVIIGVGQINQRVDHGAEALEPVDLMAEALRRADADCATTSPGAVVAGADSIRVVSVLSWRYRDPGALVAARVGASPRQSTYSTPGGNTPQALINSAAVDIATGRADLVLIAGAEAWRTRMGLRRDDQRPVWTIQGDEVIPASTFGVDTPMSHPAEMARGVMLPVQVYPLFEQALRAAEGRSVSDHLVRISELWAGFSEVAAKNPHAWIQQAFSATELRTPSPDNRMIGFPYTKRLNSNNAVEQGASLILSSVERARALGVPAERWVFPQSGTDGHDTLFVSHRGDLHSSPAIRTAGRAALRLAGIDADDLAHIDLYSCFPSAVQVAAKELGLGLDRPLTVTGGLSFAGGPWNNYVTHSVATMVERLREEPGRFGLCTANGGFLTKHAFGVYATTPPIAGFRHASPQAAIDAAGSRELAEDWAGAATVESYTVMHDRDGAPVNAVVAALTPEGRRTWATTDDAGDLASMTTDDLVGMAATLGAEGRLTLG